MTLTKAKRLKAQIELTGREAVLVEVTDGKHGDGQGYQRFDAVTLDRFHEDQRGGRYMRRYQEGTGLIQPAKSGTDSARREGRAP
jgi:hypothetical protein